MLSKNVTIDLETYQTLIQIAAAAGQLSDAFSQEQLSKNKSPEDFPSPAYAEIYNGLLYLENKAVKRDIRSEYGKKYSDFIKTKRFGFSLITEEQNNF